MTTLEFLSHLHSLDVKVWLEDNQLCINAPKGVLTQELRTELTQRKAELISFLQEVDTPAVEDQAVIRPAPRNGASPLSYAQLRLWLLDQFQPGNPAYNISGAIRLTGNLSVPVLEQSLTEMVRRHEALRTTFSVVDEQPVQVIHPTNPFQVSIVDLSFSPEATREAELGKLVAAEALYHFDLAAGPLIRATLYKLNETDHVLAFVLHHAVSDGWSAFVIIKELRTLYPAFALGLPLPLPELAIQYVDYADWQRTSIESGKFEHQLRYWKQQLGRSLPILALPLDHPRPEVRTYHGATVDLHLPGSLIEKLKGMCQSHGTTLFMALLGAFKVLLYRYTAQEDLIVGSPIANRNRLELEGLIGCFINMLALRTDMSGNPSFRELLNQVQRVALAAYENQDLPIEILTEELRPARVQDQNPLFQVSFIYQNFPSVDMTLGDLKISKWEIEKQISTLDLSLYLWEENDGLVASMEYDNVIFDKITIERMLLHYQTLLEGIVANPDTPILELPLLTQEERNKILVEWNSIPFSEHLGLAAETKCIHQLFEAQVRRTPDALALISGAEQLTYRELNARANQLAHYLQQLGVGPEVCVGLFVERSTEMIIGLLSVLKAGGAYVPLDPAYPKERLAYMIQDTQTPVILTQSSVGMNLPEYQGTTLYLDTNWDKMARESIENPISSVSASNIAYIIYTSGSTGTPKGVMIEHRSLVNYIEAASDEFNVTPSDRVLQFASINFDTSAEEIYPCLTRGATLVLRTNDMLSSAATFFQKCSEWSLTILDLPTAYWHELTISIAQEELKVPENLRLVIIGGEKAIPEHIRTWQRCVGKQVRLANTYGPTEGTIVATMYDLSEPRETNTPSETLIGRPVRNVHAYILDKNLQPVPIGVPGELHLGGAGLARGYFNAPETTSQKFTSHPFSSDPQARLYKTGDLVRYVQDGNIEFLGRVDHQVKVRGFRIELGEIESALSRHPAVRENVVVAREDEMGRKSLVAYFTPNPGTEISISELRQFIKQNLPEYMMPASFVLLDHFPMTPNGKLDRKALPAPDQSRPELEHQYVAPRDEIEEGVTSIFASVLKLERVGIQDNFFELGGHSLLATQVISRLRQQFHIDLPLHTLFGDPTPEGLAALVMKKKVDQVDDDELAALLSQLEILSPEEAQALLNAEE